MINDKYIELLKQYRSGTISEIDRHELERAALDDPFLFDAMEGYAVHGSSIDERVIKELSKKQEEGKGKVRWLNSRLMGVAASLITLIAITFVVKNQLANESNEQIAAITSESTTEESVPMTQAYGRDLVVDEEMQLQQIPTIKEEVKLENKEFGAISIGDAKNEDKESNTPSSSAVSNVQKEVEINADPNLDLEESESLNSAIPQKQEAVDDVVTVSKDMEEEVHVVFNKKPPKPNESNTRAKKKNSKPSENAVSYDIVEDESQYILGKVLGTDGSELIGVNVYIENTDIGDISDIEGNFKLPKYERGYQMVLSYTGYEDQKIVLGDQNFYQIVLQQKEDLSEVRVTRLPLVDKFKAYPAMGIEEFEIYVKDNIKFPLEAFGTAKSKKVKVSFDVDMSGKLSNFIDESKSCSDCFKEAVRLLKDSGRWETKPFGSAYRTSFTFEF